MRTFIVILLILAAIVAAVAIYLVATIPHQSTPVQIPPSASHRALLARVPASADSFALIPTAAVFHRKLTENPVTRDAVEQWSAEQPLPKPWMLGGADLLIWKSGKKTSYAIRLDPFRASVVRTSMMFSGDVEAVWDGTTVIINADASPAIDARTTDDLLRLAAGLPPGDVFAVQRDRARGAYPPIARPSVSSVRVSPSEILITSRAREDRGAAGLGTFKPTAPPVTASFPRGALLSVTFAEPPRILGDLRRLLGTDVNALVSDGGSIALYDVDAGTLLPRPRGVIAIPATEQRRAEIRNLARMADLVGETHDSGGEILVSFDRTSVGHYLKDVFEPAPWPATRWAMRIDAPRMVPLLGKLGDSRGLRFASPRFHRAARDLRRWIGALENARSIVATDSVSAGIEELRVRIASK